MPVPGGFLSDLEGKVALLTGDKGGIGAATRVLLESFGTKVVGFDLPEVDLSRVDTLKDRVDAVVAQLGRLDILINNAGVSNLGDVVETPLAELDEVMTLNFRAPFLLMQAAIPHMARAGRGAIVNNCSDMALIGKRFAAAYGASKAALAQLTKGTALDFCGRGIRVNAVAPGGTETRMLAETVTGLSTRYPSVFPGDPAFYASGIPQGRLGKPEEIARVIVFLASEASSYMTGAIVPVDGGYTAQ